MLHDRTAAALRRTLARRRFRAALVGIASTAAIVCAGSSFAEASRALVFPLQHETTVSGDGPDYTLDVEVEAVRDLVEVRVWLELPDGVVLTSPEGEVTLGDLPAGETRTTTFSIRSDVSTSFEVEVRVYGRDIGQNVDPTLSDRVRIGVPPPPAPELDADERAIVRALYGRFSDGSIEACGVEGARVYVAGDSAPDAGTTVFDADGEPIGQCIYSQDIVDPVCERVEACFTVYRVAGNIWGQPPVDALGLSGE